MADIGPYTASTSFELVYNRPNGPPVEVEIEVTGVLYCDASEYGVEARDVAAKIVARDLTEEEVDALELEAVLAERFSDSEPCHPREGDHYKSTDGFVWKVVDTFLTWGETRDHYVLIERSNFRFDLRGPTERRRLVQLHEFAHGTDAEGKPLFERTANAPATAPDKSGAL